MADAIGKLMAGDFAMIGVSTMDYGPILAEVPDALVLINGGVLEHWVAANPASASKFLTEEILAGRVPARSQRMVVNWAMNDAPAAAAWVETLPAGEFRRDAIANVLDTWSRVDRDAAEAWKAGMAGP
jgi:hypothetical protein